MGGSVGRGGEWGLWEGGVMLPAPCYLSPCPARAVFPTTTPVTPCRCPLHYHPHHPRPLHSATLSVNISLNDVDGRGGTLDDKLWNRSWHQLTNKDGKLVYLYKDDI